MNRNEFHQRQVADQLSGIVKTIRYGDHVSIRYWDLDDESDSIKLIDYRNRNRGKALIKETLYL